MIGRLGCTGVAVTRQGVFLIRRCYRHRFRVPRSVALTPALSTNRFCFAYRDPVTVTPIPFPHSVTCINSQHVPITLAIDCPTVAAQAWNNAVAQAWKRIQSDDPVHALARAMREGRGDTVMVKPQWNMPIPGEKRR